jgi:hypothetical protein
MHGPVVIIIRIPGSTILVAETSEIVCIDQLLISQNGIIVRPDNDCIFGAFLAVTPPSAGLDRCDVVKEASGYFINVITASLYNVYKAGIR